MESIFSVTAARNFKTARLAYSLYGVDIQCDSKGLTSLSGLMSRIAGLHGKPVTF